MGRSPEGRRAAGKRWERDLRDCMRKAGIDIEQLRLTGTEDEGDSVVGHEPRYVVHSVDEFIQLLHALEVSEQDPGAGTGGSHDDPQLKGLAASREDVGS